MLDLNLSRRQPADKNYKWIALSNTTLGGLLVGLDGSCVMIALPAIFRGINLNPLGPESSAYLLWILTGYTLVLALREIGIHKQARIDWMGNLTFAAGLTLLLVGVTYGIQPSGASSMS